MRGCQFTIYPNLTVVPIRIRVRSLEMEMTVFVAVAGIFC
jgi:hypothetical protein